jgi:hypothetical protein
MKLNTINGVVLRGIFLWYTVDYNLTKVYKNAEEYPPLVF